MKESVKNNQCLFIIKKNLLHILYNIFEPKISEQCSKTGSCAFSKIADFLKLFKKANFVWHM